MDWKDLAATVSRTAPMLGMLLGGPAGAAVGGLIASTLGTDADPAQVSAALTANPDLVVKLQQIESDRRARLQDMVLAHAKLVVEDRKDARQANVTSGMQPAVFWLSIVLLGMSLGSEVAVLFVGYPPGLPDLVVGRVLGLLDAVAMMVLAYWYGTTNGSAQKTELLAQSSPAR